MKRPPETIIRLPAEDFSLSKTLESAQLFRAFKEGDGYVVHSGARQFFARQTDATLEVAGAPEVDAAFVKHFFALDERFADIEARLAHCPELAEAIEACRGIRIMRQDPWECLVGFICSSCCNVPRIEKVVRAICDAAGAPAAGWRAFPDPGKLPDEAELRRLGAGYRAAYLSGINAPHMRHWLDGLRPRGFAQARAELCSLPGVGEKVADCVLLHSLGFRQAFPVDVWVRRAMRGVYFGGRAATDREIQRLAAERFGRDAGYAQLFLFHHWRTRKDT